MGAPDLKTYYRYESGRVAQRRWRGRPPHGWFDSVDRAINIAISQKEEQILLLKEDLVEARQVLRVMRKERPDLMAQKTAGPVPDAIVEYCVAQVGIIERDARQVLAQEGGRVTIKALVEFLTEATLERAHDRMPIPSDVDQDALERKVAAAIRKLYKGGR